jgi:hypothetical protein
MGLLWSLAPALGARKGIRLLPRDTRQPMAYNFHLYRGHYTDETRLLAETPISSVSVNRHFIHPDVQRVEVKHGRLRGAMFLPKSWLKNSYFNFFLNDGA